MALLEVNYLKTYYITLRGPVKAVDGVSLHVEKGEGHGAGRGVWLWQNYGGPFSLKNPTSRRKNPRWRDSIQWHEPSRA